MNPTAVGFAIVTTIFVAGIVYGLNGGTIPSVAVMIVCTIGATIFGIATVTTK